MELRNAVLVDGGRSALARCGRGELAAARRVTSVAMELRRSNTRHGRATQCIGAGMDISTIIGRLD